MSVRTLSQQKLSTNVYNKRNIKVLRGSVVFDGSGDYLSEPGSSGQYAFGTAAFTVECWIRTTSATARQCIYSNNTSSLGTGPIIAVRGEGTTGRIILGEVGQSNSLETADNAITANAWYHVALVREGTGTNQTKLYINGSLAATGTYSSNLSTSRTMQIGATVYYGEYFNGYISNLRVTKSAVYTGAFTAPTSSLVAVSGTTLLTCQNPTTVVDNSGNNWTITRNGDAAASSTSPF